MTPGTLFAPTYDCSTDAPVLQICLAFIGRHVVHPQLAITAKHRVYNRAEYSETCASRETIAQLEYEDSITDDSVCYDYILWEK